VKRVLFIAYHFPPVGGAGVQRSLKFARYLPDSGWTPIVLTGPGEAFGEWAPIDESLMAELGGRAEVHRVPGPVPEDTYGRIDRLLARESDFSGWWRAGVLAEGRRHRDIDLICATMSPWESGFAAAELARDLDVPLVLDLRDPWALDEMLSYTTRFHARLDLRRMRRTLAQADAIVMNCPEAGRQVREHFPELAGIPVDVVPNGFDAEDFASPPPARPADGLRIVHTGYLHTSFGSRRRDIVRGLLGGLPQGDPLTRSHVVLMQALELLSERSPEIAQGVELHLAGQLSEADRSVDRLGVVREHGYLGHAACVELMRSADLLFLPMHDLPAGRRARIVPGKTYEYLGSGRPILAGAPDGDAREMLTALPWAHVCRPRDAEAMAAAIADEVSRKRARGGPAPDGDRALVEQFERRALTRRFAGVFDRLVAGGESALDAAVPSAA
jgi:glycosyltransferase involved in cell wall biosynthesis